MGHGLAYRRRGGGEHYLPAALCGASRWLIPARLSAGVPSNIGQYPHARSMLVQLGALGPLVQCLESAPQQETRNLAMLALSNIARGGPGLASAVADAGAMEPLDELLWSSA